jgi:hypothetical protein
MDCEPVVSCQLLCGRGQAAPSREPVENYSFAIDKARYLATVPSLAPWHCWLEDRRIYDPRTFQSYIIRYMVAQSPKLLVGSKLSVPPTFEFFASHAPLSAMHH